MTATGHAILGTVIAAKFANPYLAIPLALLSHIAADAFPHWDTATNEKKKQRTRLWIDSIIDVFLSFFVSYLLIVFVFPQTQLTYAFLMVFVAQGLDWLTAPYFFLHLNIPPFNWSYKLQKLFDNRLDKPWGIINQVVILILIIVLAKIF